MSTAYLLIGTNLGNKEENIKKATKLLKKAGRIKKHSAIYETEPWGFADDRNFFNMAVCFETLLNPFELLNEILKIEISIGRKALLGCVPRRVNLPPEKYRSRSLASSPGGCRPSGGPARSSHASRASPSVWKRVGRRRGRYPGGVFGVCGKRFFRRAVHCRQSFRRFGFDRQPGGSAVCCTARLGRGNPSSAGRFGTARASGERS